jgi:HSP20 family protein
MSGTKLTEEAKFDSSGTTDQPAFTSHIRLPFHHSTTGTTQAGNTTKAPQQAGRGILLSERLIGNFHRTFAFPMPVVEEAIKANLEDGLLSLLIPKKVKCKDMDQVRRISIVQRN